MFSMAEVIRGDFPAIKHVVINLDFLEEPSEKPTTDLIRVQMDRKTSIGQSLQRILRVC